MTICHHDTNRASLLPSGEGQDEGISNQVASVISSPTPRFALPNPLGNCSMRCSSTDIHVGVPEGEGGAEFYFRVIPCASVANEFCFFERINKT
jgi:hypothetical protein